MKPNNWKIKDDSRSPREHVDLVAPAQRLAASLAETKDREGRVVLVFCDPAFNPHDRKDWEGPFPPGSVLNKPSPRRSDFATEKAFREADQRHAQEAREFYQAYRAEVQRNAREAGREQLRRQLAPQIEYLIQEGVLPRSAVPTERFNVNTRGVIRG